MILFLEGMEKPHICAFDIEHDQGRLIQFAGIIFQNVGGNLYQISRSLNVYIKQPYLSEFISTFSRIDEDFINMYGVELEEAQEQFNSFIDGLDDILFASHGIFQDSLILKENGIQLGAYDHLCTYELAKRVLDRKNQLSLNSIANECGCMNVGNHNAYGDALTTAYILSFLLKKQGELDDENA